MIAVIPVFIQPRVVHRAILTMSWLIAQLSSRGTISTVYFLKPLHKSRSRLLKKLLGLKASKKRPKIPLFKVSVAATFAKPATEIECFVYCDLFYVYLILAERTDTDRQTDRQTHHTHTHKHTHIHTCIY